MIKIIENNMKEPISITCGECKSIFSFEYTDIQRKEERNLLFPVGITNIRRFIVCPVCKGRLIRMNTIDAFEKETLKFFEDIVSYGAKNHVCISVDNTIIEYFKVAIEAIRQRR